MQKNIILIIISLSAFLFSCGNASSDTKAESGEKKHADFESFWKDFQKAVKTDNIEDIEELTHEANRSTVKSQYKKLISKDIKKGIANMNASELLYSNDTWRTYSYKIMRKDDFNPEFETNHYSININFNLRDGKWYLMSIEQAG